MSCERYESSIVAYVLGELSPGEAAACRSHVEACERCRAACEGYVGLVRSIEDEPESAPTALESEALSRALARVQPAGARVQREPLPRGLPALMWGSFAAFVVVVSVLSLYVSGCFSLVGVARSIGPAPIAAAVAVTIFVTSFLPIAVAARRKPLNGMTFRR